MKLLGQSTKQQSLCPWVEENAPLYCYGDLSDADQEKLEQHLESCASCRTEVTSIQAVFATLHAEPMPQPSPSLLAASRIRLSEALDQAAPPHKGRFAIAMDAWSFHLRAVPSLAALLLACGVAAGGAGGWLLALRNAPAQRAAFVNSSGPALDLPGNIASVNSITQQPGTGLVQVSYNALVPGTISAVTGDPRIQQLLLLAAQNRANPGVRVNSVGLLADQCREGSTCAQQPVRDTLRASLRYDANPAVRLKALEGLAPLVAQDTAVRDSVLEALLHDSNPGVRTEAIQLLTPVGADGSVRTVLHTLANSDDNPYIRNVSQETLAEQPEMQ